MTSEIIDTAAMDLVLAVSDILGISGDERRAAELVSARLQSAYRAGQREPMALARELAEYVANWEGVRGVGFLGQYPPFANVLCRIKELDDRIVDEANDAE